MRRFFLQPRIPRFLRVRGLYLGKNLWERTTASLCSPDFCVGMAPSLRVRIAEKSRNSLFAGRGIHSGILGIQPSLRMGMRNTVGLPAKRSLTHGADQRHHALHNLWPGMGHQFTQTERA